MFLWIVSCFCFIAIFFLWTKMNSVFKFCCITDVAFQAACCMHRTNSSAAWVSLYLVFRDNLKLIVLRIWHLKSICIVLLGFLGISCTRLKLLLVGSWTRYLLLPIFQSSADYCIVGRNTIVGWFWPHLTNFTSSSYFGRTLCLIRWFFGHLDVEGVYGKSSLYGHICGSKYMC